MLMIGYALNKKEKRILALRGPESPGKVRSLRARSGVSGKSGFSGKKSGLSGLQHNSRKTDITQFFNLA
jgi:hypothetical protein